MEVTIVPPNAATEVTKYYYFGGQRVAMRKNGVLTYLHSDHLGSTVLETNASGTVTSDEKYRAYGKQRDTGTVSTDHRFTGQKEDASGLQYFNARFYDPVIGMFVSPDTIVPQPGLASDYNRYLAFRGNPLRFVDPTGHYSETELEKHFGCGDSDWNCVLVNFHDGGKYAGLWGWLQILQAAQDGDIVQSTLMLQQDSGMMQNASIQGIFTRENGHIFIRDGKSVGFDGATSSWSGSISEFGFAQFANAGGGSTSLLNFGVYQMQGQKSGFMQVMKDSKTCGVPENCSTMILDGISTGASGVAVGCAMAMQPECAGPASTISTIASGLSTGITAIGTLRRHEDWPDLVVSIVTFGIGAKYGKDLRGFGASVFQSWYDSGD